VILFSAITYSPHLPHFPFDYAPPTVYTCLACLLPVFFTFSRLPRSPISTYDFAVGYHCLPVCFVRCSLLRIYTTPQRVWLRCHTTIPPVTVTFRSFSACHVLQLLCLRLTAVTNVYAVLRLEHARTPHALFSTLPVCGYVTRILPRCRFTRLRGMTLLTPERPVVDSVPPAVIDCSLLRYT